MKTVPFRLTLSGALLACALFAVTDARGEVRVSDRCSLAEALRVAQGAEPMGGCVSAVPSSAVRISGTFEISDDLELPVIDGTVHLVGDAATLVVPESRRATPLFEVSPSGDLRIERIAIVGGRIDNRGRLTLLHSTLAEAEGSGLVTRGELELIDSIVRDALGDGIESLGGGTLRVVNSRVAGNGGDGVSTFGSDFVIIANSTVVNTTITDNGGVGVENSGYLNDEILLERSIVTGNVGRDCQGGGVQGAGNNFDSDGTCPTAEPMSGLDPVLADNGGPTRTHALLPGSAAIDADADCQFAADQRGVLFDELCDAGAYELATPEIELESSATCPGPMTFTVTGATPDAEVSLQIGRRPGRDLFAQGDCAGSVSAIASPVEVAVGAADADGTAVLSLEVGSNQCGKTLQAIDLTLCSPSSITPVGSPPE